VDARSGAPDNQGAKAWMGIGSGHRHPADAGGPGRASGVDHRVQSSELVVVLMDHVIANFGVEARSASSCLRFHGAPKLLGALFWPFEDSWSLIAVTWAAPGRECRARWPSPADADSRHMGLVGERNRLRRIQRQQTRLMPPRTAGPPGRGRRRRGSESPGLGGLYVAGKQPLAAHHAGFSEIRRRGSDSPARQRVQGLQLPAIQPGPQLTDSLLGNALANSATTRPT